MPLTVCPACEAEAYFRVIYAVPVVDSTPRTMGAAADRNDNTVWASEMREKDDIQSGRKALRESPWRTSDSPDEGTMRKLVDDPEAARRYILTGKATESLTPEIRGS